MFDPVPPPLTVTEVLDAPDQAAAWLAEEVPGPDGLAALSLLDPAGLSHAGRVDLLVAYERAIAFLTAGQQRVLAVLADRPADAADAVDKTGREWVREDVACALRLAPVTAQARLSIAAELAGRLPDTARLLRRGEISLLHARALVEAVAGIDDAAAAAVQARVLPRAGEQTLAGFKRSVARAVAAVHPMRTEDRHREALAERRVGVSPRDDGMAELWALLPAEGAAAVLAAVDALASVTSADDARTADQRRADALVDLGVAALHDPHLPTTQGLRPAVQVTVALSTLLGVDEQPGELAGHGPIPAALARRLAADPTGTWRRMVTDPLSGRLLDYGTSTYRPPADLARFVIARDQHCTFPTCRRAAHRCDLDHQTPAGRGGATSAANLAALCRRHHRAKHQAGWQVHRDDTTGTSHWTSPTGHHYQNRPDAYPRDHTRTTCETDIDPPPY